MTRTKGRGLPSLTARRSPASISARVLVGHAEPAEQVGEDLLEQVAGPLPVLELDGAEAEHLVSGELEVPGAAVAVGVPGRIRRAG